MNFTSPPLSRLQLRELARIFRKGLMLDDAIKLPVTQIVESFPLIIGDEDFYFEYVDNSYFPENTHAAYYPEDNCIRVKESVYLSACNGDGRDRMTLMHEISHALLLKVCGVQFNRRFEGQVVEPFRDPEWQAKCLAAELMIPYHLVKDWNPFDIAEKCEVSFQAACYQKSKFK